MQSSQTDVYLIFILEDVRGGAGESARERNKTADLVRKGGRVGKISELFWRFKKNEF